MPIPLRPYFTAPALMALLAVLKGYYVFRFGPIIYSSDLFHYLHYSTLILGDQDWLSDAGLDDYHRQTTMLRMIGYPLVIAAARQISTDQWAWVVVGLQIVLSLYASLWVWRLGVAISGQRWVGFCAGLAVGSGLALRFDQMILTDSPTASLIIITYCILATAVVTRKKVSLAQAICISLLIAAAFLLRDSVRAIAFFFIPLIGLSLWRFRPLWGGALRTVLMLGPVLVVMTSYQQWNEMRTGERFITTIPHSGFMISMMKASANGAQIFVDDTPLDKLAREEFKTYHFREVLYIVKRLQVEYGFSEPQVTNLVQAKYKQTWLLHPGAMMRAYLAEISPRQALYVISPLFSDLDIRTRTQGDGTQGPTSGGDKVRALWNEGSVEAYALLSLYGLQALASITVSLAFFIYPLMLIGQSVRAHQLPDRQAGTILALWAFYAGMIALVALSEFTPRYLMPVMPIVAVIGFTGLGRFVRFYRSTLASR